MPDRDRETIDQVMRELEDLGQLNPLTLAMALVQSQSEVFVLFMRLGDHDTPADATARAFAIVGSEIDNGKLRDVVAKWALRN